MCYVDFLVLVTHAKGKRHLVFDNQLAFLKPCYGGADVLQFAATYTVQVADYSVVDGLDHGEVVLAYSVMNKLVVDAFHLGYAFRGSKIVQLLKSSALSILNWQ